MFFIPIVVAAALASTGIAVGIGNCADRPNHDCTRSTVNAYLSAPISSAPMKLPPPFAPTKLEHHATYTMYPGNPFPVWHYPPLPEPRPINAEYLNRGVCDQSAAATHSEAWTSGYCVGAH